MPLQNSEKNNYLYNRGLFTESSELNRPDGTSIDEQDFIIQRDGMRKRRYGWKPLAGSTNKVPSTLSYTAFPYIKVGYWENAGGVYQYPIVVVQINQYLYFFADKGDALTAFPDTQRINLYDYVYDGSGIAVTGTYYEVEFSSGGPVFFVTSQNMTPIYLSYEYLTIGGVPGYYIIARQVHMLERDVEGLEDGFGPGYKPVIDDPVHRYNLYNQGWNSGGIATYFAALGYYPSNNQVWEEGLYTNPGTGLRAWSAPELNQEDFGSGYVARGRYIQSVHGGHNRVTDYYKAYKVNTVVYVPGAPNRIRITHLDTRAYLVGDYIFLKDIHVVYIDTSGRKRSKSIQGYFQVSVVHAASDISIDYTLNEYSSAFLSLSHVGTISTELVSKLTIPGGYQGIGQGFRAIAHHEGRLFVAGINDPYRNVYSKRVYFSSLERTQSDFSKFYSDNDPTSSGISDPLETDGGFVTIPNVGIIKKLVSYGSALIVMADNGIWAILPAIDPGYFTALSYTVTKISDIGLLDSSSVVIADNAIFFWTQIGIHTMQTDPATQRPRVQNVSEAVIKRLIHDTVDTTTAIRGCYDKLNNVIYWMYRSKGLANKETYRLNKVLVLDLAVGAYSKMSLPLVYESSTQWSYPLALAYSQPEKAIAGSAASIDPTRRLRLLKADKDGGAETIEWMEMKEDTTEGGPLDFVDYSPVTRFNVEALPYLETSYEYGAGPTHKKWCTGVTAFFERTENRAYITSGGVSLFNPSSCLLRAKWEFADSSVSNKWSPQQQIYRLQRFRLPTTTYSGSPITEDWDNGYPVVKTRNKIRGNGSVLSLRFDTEATKHCNLIGWHLDLLESRTTE